MSEAKDNLNENNSKNKNTTDLDHSKKTETIEENSDKKPSPDQIESDLHTLLTEGIPSGRMEFKSKKPNFYDQIKIYRNNYQDKVYKINQENNTCERLALGKNNQSLNGLVGMFIKELFDYSGEPCAIYNVSYVKIKNLTQRLLSDPGKMEIFVKPLALGFKGGTDLCIHRYDFDRVKNPDEGLYPKWKELTSTWDGNKEAILYLLGCAISNKPIVRKIIFMYGDSGSGKNTTMKVIKHIYGEKNCLKGSRKLLTDKFAWVCVEDNLMVQIDEPNNDFINSDDLKDATGDDVLSVRPMHHAPIEIENRCNFFITANPSKLKPSGEDAIWKERMVGTIKTPPDELPLGSPTEIAAEFIPEIPYIVSMILDIYDAKTLNDFEIDTSMFDAVIAENNAEFDSLFDDHFVLQPNWNERGVKPTISLVEWGRIMRRIKKQDHNFKEMEFREYVQKKVGSKNFTRSVYGKTGKWVTGIVINKTLPVKVPSYYD